MIGTFVWFRSFAALNKSVQLYRPSHGDHNCMPIGSNDDRTDLFDLSASETIVSRIVCADVGCGKTVVSFHSQEIYK